MTSHDGGVQADDARIRDFVHLNFRYKGAWDEYDVRISSRHNIIAIYTASSGIILGFLQQYIKTSEAYNPWVWFFMSTVPAAAFVMARTLLMHDRIMSRLHAYLIDCEKVRNEDERLPSYHWNRERTETFMNSRAIQDVSLFRIISILVLAAVVMCSSNITYVRPDHFYIDPIGIIIGSYLYWIIYYNSYLTLQDARLYRIETCSAYFPDIKLPRGLLSGAVFADIRFMPTKWQKAVFERLETLFRDLNNKDPRP